MYLLMPNFSSKNSTLSAVEMKPYLRENCTKSELESSVENCQF